MGRPRIRTSEYILEYKRAWHRGNRERRLREQREYRKKNKEKIRAHSSRLYFKDKALRAAGHKVTRFINGAKKRFALRLRALRKVSDSERPRCVVCGNDDPRLLTINHINGDGNADRKMTTFGNMPLAILRGGRDVTDLDVRCYNCNILYEYQRGKGDQEWYKTYFSDLPSKNINWNIEAF